MNTFSRLRWQPLLPCVVFAMIVISLMSVTITHAENVIVNGADGENGSPGWDNPGGHGGDGAPGADAVAVANAVGDTTNSATANAGSGGDAGFGFESGDAGDASDGGDATASATTNVSTAGPTATASASATGGNAGNGNNGGSQNPGPDGFGSPPGLAGSAHASATAIDTAVGGNVNVSATAQGGSGGSGGWPPAFGGSDGAGATLGTVYGQSNGGTATVSAEARGGSGGMGAPGIDGIGGGNGGAGFSISLSNALSGSTTGRLNLNQTAAGGRGGDARDGASAGTAGSASSSLTLTDTNSSYIDAYARADGGQGGRGFGTSGGDGATAEAVIEMTGSGIVEVEAEARGGNGGADEDGGYQGGDGGIATAFARGVSTGGGAVRVESLNHGGSGANGTTSGSGADAIAVDDVSGSTSGILRLVQRSEGGHAGNAGAGLSVGLAGNSISNLTATNPGGGPLEGTVDAMGGTGGIFNSDGPAGDGGNAAAPINLSSSTNTVLAVSDAGGGDGGNNLGTGLDGLNGIATATSYATTLHGYTATSRALAIGRSAVATAQSNTSGGAIASMSLTATTSNKEAVSAQSLAALGAGFTTNITGFNTMATSYGLPTASNVNTQLSGDPNVTAAYNSPHGKTPLALSAMRLAPSNTMTATPVFSVTADYSFDVAQLTGGELLIGLLDPTSSGPGFSALQFSIEREGVVVENQIFTSMASAIVYFDDHVLDLGSITSDVVGLLDLSISLTMVSPDNNTRFFASLLIAEISLPAIPDPSADFDDDGDVDGRDFLTWQRGAGLTGQTNNSHGDADFDGTVDGEDLGIWQTQYETGPPLAAAIAVPEPTGCVLGLFAVIGFLGRGSLKRSGM